ncbi:conserved hypothetical protein [Hoeflea sp. EC-HK425]|nr:conserved hypothetical protein [Hoeflea sp. EC-HK425]
MHPEIVRFRANTIPDHAASGRAAQSAITGFPVIGPVPHPPIARTRENRLLAKPFTRKGSIQIAEIANGLIDPILARRAGINTLLLGSWDEIAGEQFADCSRPERIRWPRQDGPDETGGGFAPGVLTVACEGARALFLMHQEAELISRVNSFFGFQAISQVRIVQKAIHVPTRKPKARPLDQAEKSRLASMLGEIEDPKLRQALERLGTGVIGRAPKQRR